MLKKTYIGHGTSLLMPNAMNWVQEILTHLDREFQIKL